MGTRCSRWPGRPSLGIGLKGSLHRHPARGLPDTDQLDTVNTQKRQMNCIGLLDTRYNHSFRKRPDIDLRGRTRIPNFPQMRYIDLPDNSDSSLEPMCLGTVQRDTENTILPQQD